MGGLWGDSNSNVYFEYDRISRINPAGMTETRSLTQSNGDGGAATSATFNRPAHLFMATTGVMHVSDNHRLRMIYADQVVVTFGGHGSPVSGGDGGKATSAGFNGV